MKKAILNTAALAAMMAAAPAAVIARPKAEAPGDVAALLKEVQTSVKGMREDLFPKAEKALKDAAKAGEIGVELKAEIDKLLPQFNAFTSAQSKLEGKLEAMESRALDLEQTVAAGISGRGGKSVSAGRELAESDELKAYLAAGRPGALEMGVKAQITTVGGSGGGLIWSDREPAPVNMPRRNLLIRSLLNVVTTGQTGSVEYTRQTTRTNNAAMVAETAAAPASTFGWTKAEAIMRKIAHVTHVSEEALSDAAMLEGEVNGELAYGLDLVEETQLLTGNGSGQNLSGLITNATAFSAAAGLPNAQRIDRLRLAILQVTLADYAADAIVLNPTDWAAIELLKDAENRYLFGVPGNPGNPALWRLPIVESNSMTAGTWLVGSMRMAATLYDRMETMIRISSEHGDNFVEGMLTMKATKRVALAVKRPASLVTGNFTFG
jgi:HK97 family phage major capsid protein